jgi:hypothetical protein
MNNCQILNKRRLTLPSLVFSSFIITNILTFNTVTALSKKNTYNNHSFRIAYNNGNLLQIGYSNAFYLKENSHLSLEINSFTGTFLDPILNTSPRIYKRRVFLLGITNFQIKKYYQPNLSRLNSGIYFGAIFSYFSYHNNSSFIQNCTFGGRVGWKHYLGKFLFWNLSYEQPFFLQEYQSKTKLKTVFLFDSLNLSIGFRKNF